MSLRPCPVPSCPNLTTGGRCAAHARPAWRSATTPPRIRGRALQRKRRELFARQPYCPECMKEGRVTLNTIRDHIVPLVEGGPDTDENTQGLCQAHSDVKTARERQRGSQRARGMP